MTRNDYQILFAALGFTAVTMQGAIGTDLATRAHGLAMLTEEFCRNALPEAFAPEDRVQEASSDNDSINTLINQFKTELQEREAAHLPKDRETLLKFYDRLLFRQMRREQHAFYSTAPDALIANRVITLIDEELNHEAGA